MLPFVIILVAIGVGVAIYFSWLAAKKRREAMQQIAASLGLQFQSDKDYSYDERYPFLNKLCQGDSRYAYNVMYGNFRGFPIQLFDYHYQTYSTDSKGSRKTQHHYFSFFMLQLDREVPELLISREGWFSKFTQFLGFDDIDFESAEFSRQFVVKCSDKKFAYDICHGQMIEYLLANSDLNIELDRNCLALFFSRPLSLDKIRYNLDRLVTIRELFPGYLFERAI